MVVLLRILGVVLLRTDDERELVGGAVGVDRYVGKRSSIGIFAKRSALR